MCPTVEKRKRKLSRVSFPKDNFTTKLTEKSLRTHDEKTSLPNFSAPPPLALIGWVFKPVHHLNPSPLSDIRSPKRGRVGVILLALEEHAVTTGIGVFLHSYIAIYWLGISTAAFWVPSLYQYQLKSFLLEVQQDKENVFLFSGETLSSQRGLIRFHEVYVSFLLTSVSLSLQVSNGDMAEAVAFLTEKNAKVPQQDETTYYQTSQVASDRYISVGSQADTSKQCETSVQSQSYW